MSAYDARGYYEIRKKIYGTTRAVGICRKDVDEARCELARARRGLTSLQRRRRTTLDRGMRRALDIEIREAQDDVRYHERCVTEQREILAIAVAEYDAADD